jgi:hypothetical protein
VSVVGFECPLTERQDRVGAKGALYGIEMVTLENGAIVKSGHGGVYRNSVWYTLYGSKGRMETAREDAQNDAYDRVYTYFDEYSGGYETGKIETYIPETINEKQSKFAHGGSDFWSMYYFIERIKGDETADVIDVYEALDMSLVGHFAYRSILAGGVSVAIPNLRNKEEREKWRNDVACCDKKAAGENVWPTRKAGTPTIEKEIYGRQKVLFEKDLNSNDGYSSWNFNNTK